MNSLTIIPKDIILLIYDNLSFRDLVDLSHCEKYLRNLYKNYHRIISLYSFVRHLELLRTKNWDNYLGIIYKLNDKSTHIKFQLDYCKGICITQIDPYTEDRYYLSKPWIFDKILRYTLGDTKEDGFYMRVTIKIKNHLEPILKLLKDQGYILQGGDIPIYHP